MLIQLIAKALKHARKLVADLGRLVGLGLASKVPLLTWHLLVVVVLVVVANGC